MVARSPSWRNHDPASRRRPARAARRRSRRRRRPRPAGRTRAGSGDVPFRDPALPIDTRVDDLVGRLTLDEKVALMIERAAPVERLGIPAFPWWNEALQSARSATGRRLPASREPVTFPS